MFLKSLSTSAYPLVAGALTAQRSSKASAWGVGVNWYLNQNYKWSLNYDVTSFEGGAAAGADRPDERAVFTRFALQF